jgi:alkylation response protein AidB-like acyl-CoA dehydrogenase
MSYNYTKSLFDDEHEIFRNSYRRFLETEADGHVDDGWSMERSRVVLAQGRRTGFLAVECQEEYGGPGGDFSTGS